MLYMNDIYFIIKKFLKRINIDCLSKQKYTVQKSELLIFQMSFLIS